VFRIDEQFKKNKGRYFFQCFLVFLVMLVLLFVLDFLPHAALVASLGASAFIAFAIPHKQVARPRFLIGGYLVGILVGSGCCGISRIPWPETLAAAEPYADELFGALAVGLAMLVMVVTDTEHPPAAGIALGLVIEEWSLRTVAVALVGIVLLAVLKSLLRPILRDLL
jgi:CBS-domain-containing membrane protein